MNIKNFKNNEITKAYQEALTYSLRTVSKDHPFRKWKCGTIIYDEKLIVIDLDNIDMVSEKTGYPMDIVANFVIRHEYMHAFLHAMDLDKKFSKCILEYYCDVLAGAWLYKDTGNKIYFACMRPAFKRKYNAFMETNFDNLVSWLYDEYCDKENIFSECHVDNYKYYGPDEKSGIRRVKDVLQGSIKFLGKGKEIFIALASSEKEARPGKRR